MTAVPVWAIAAARRVRGMIVAPRAEWALVAREPHGVGATLAFAALTIVPSTVLVALVSGIEAALVSEAVDLAFVAMVGAILMLVLQVLRIPRPTYPRAVAVAAYALSVAFLGSAVGAPLGAPGAIFAFAAFVYAFVLIGLALPIVFGGPRERVTVFATSSGLASIVAYLCLAGASGAGQSGSRPPNGDAVPRAEMQRRTDLLIRSGQTQQRQNDEALRRQLCDNDPNCVNVRISP